MSHRSQPVEAPAPTEMLDLLAEGANTRSWIDIDDAPRRTTASVWSEAANVAGALAVQRCRVAGIFLDASPASLSALLGGWRAGVRMVSLPHPPRKGDPTQWQRDVRRALELSDCDALIGEPPSKLLDHDADQIAVADLLAGPARRCPDVPGSFVQFTSGSTGAARGIVLSLGSMSANATAILERTAHAEPVLCSWLPWSHDMGLMSLLTTWICCGPRWAGAGALRLLSTDRFAANPASWMRACSDVRATVTVAPSLAYGIADRFLPRSSAIDLSSLRVAMVGAEPIDAAAMRRFTAAAAERGLAPTAIAPAYGLAEATVGVTLSGLDDPFSTAAVSAPGLAEDRWRAPLDAEPMLELARCGRPLDGVEIEVRDTGTGRVGPLFVRSPACATEVLGGDLPIDQDGWLATNDLGVIDEGQLVVIGRSDDLLMVAGRNVHGAALDEALREDAAVRAQRAVGVLNGRGGFTVVIERRAGRDDPAFVAARARKAVVAAIGASPADVIIVPPGSMPRTTSGKVRRHVLRAMLAGGTATITHRQSFRPDE